jgi:hypothetical protein
MSFFRRTSKPTPPSPNHATDQQQQQQQPSTNNTITTNPPPTSPTTTNNNTTTNTSTKFDIMISLNVGTNLNNAKKLKSLLETKYNKKVFLCTDDEGGANFRNSIVNAIKQSRVVILLMNSAWANSGECEDEFLLAKRLMLTSHERRVTLPTQARRPKLLPVAFPDLAPWDRFPGVELLAASTNFVMAQGNEFSTTELDRLAKESAMACEDHIVSSTAIHHHDVGSSAESAIDSMQTYLEEALRLLKGPIQHSTHSMFQRNTIKIETKNNTLSRTFPLPLKRYLGLTHGHIGEYRTIFSLELEITIHGNQNQTKLDEHFHHVLLAEGIITWKVLDVTKTEGGVVTNNTTTNETLTHAISEFGEKIMNRKEKESRIVIKGTFTIDNGLLSLHDDVIEKDDIGFISESPFPYEKEKYRLVINDDGTMLNGLLSNKGDWDIAFRATAL